MVLIMHEHQLDWVMQLLECSITGINFMVNRCILYVVEFTVTNSNGKKLCTLGGLIPYLTVQ